MASDALTWINRLRAHEAVTCPFDLDHGRYPAAPPTVAVGRRAAMKQIYRVSFFKKLTDSNGHPVDAWQGAVEVRATSRDGAIDLARPRFADLKDVGSWTLRADYETVELLASRKHVSMRPWRNRHEELSLAR
jgi:hypothetical protein